MNLTLLLQMAADGMGKRLALGARERALSYAALDARVQCSAAWLARRDAANVVFLGLNSPAFPLALFASAASGKTFIPLNYRLPDATLLRLCERCAPAVVIADADQCARVSGVAGLELVTREDFLRAEAAPASVAPVENDVALWLFTSGTTGEPKAAVLRHCHLTSYILQTVEFAAAGEDEAALVSVPPYHIAGVSAVLSSVYAGRRLVQLASFAPQDWIATVQREGITHAMLVPTMLSRILDEIDRTAAQLPSLRHLSYGGGRMPAAVIERALRRLPQVDFVNAYGLTETSSTIAVLDPNDHRRAFGSDDPRVRRRLGSVGRPLPGLELSIRDADGRALGSDRPGEIWVRGAQVSGEYVGMRVLREDGWLPTRDCGWLDDSGYLYVDGRLDDVIVRGGENISPGEVEDVLRAHPGVADVAVIGLPDDDWGEKVAAVVVPAAVVDAAELNAWVAARLRSTKAPQAFFFREGLPYNETGKLLRRVLRQELAA